MEAIKPIETRYKGYRFRSRLEARWAVFLDVLGVAWEYEKEGFELSTGERYLPDFWLPDNSCWIEIKGQPMSDAERRKVGLLAAESRKWVDVLIGQPWPGEFTVRAFHTALPPEDATKAWQLLCTLESLWPARTFLQAYAERHYHMGRWVTPALVKRESYLADWAKWQRGHPQIDEWFESDRILGICRNCGRLMFGYPATEELNEVEIDRKDMGNGRFLAIIQRDDWTMPDHFLPCDVCDWSEGEPIGKIEGTDDDPRLTAAFEAARGARFERGESGA